jgi:glycosyltransferase involved in cell wall biosynthesis
MRRYTWELFGALAAIEPQIRIVAVGAPSDTALPSGVERSPASPSFPTNVGWMLTGLPLSARRVGLDLFHAPSYTAPIGGPRPLVLTIHDVSYERHPEWYPYRRDPIRRAFYRWSARSADRILTDSEFSKREIVAAYGLSPESIAVVPLAASETFQPGPALPLPKGVPEKYILHVGDLHARRNLPMLARIIARLRKSSRSPDLALVLVGLDYGGGAALRQISADGVGPGTLILERIGEEQLLALYRSAIALAYPSRYEGFGLPLVEAMASGTPVVAAATSSIPEVVGDAGVLLDPDDEAAWEETVSRLIQDAVFGQRMRDAGLARAARFSWKRTAEATAGVYRDLLGVSAGPV